METKKKKVVKKENKKDIPDYVARFINEYKELDERCYKLNDMLKKWIKNKLDFEPKCSYELLKFQLLIMNDYKKILEKRAKIEKIKLEKYKKEKK